MIKQTFINDTLKSLSSFLPESSAQIATDVEKNLRAVLEKRLLQFDLVSKEEFTANQQLLKRLKQRVEQLEEEIAALKQAD